MHFLFAVVCILQATLVRNSLSENQAVIQVDFMNENCGDNFTVESDDGIKVVEFVENNVIECDDLCPFRSFDVTVKGKSGKHKLLIYTINEGQDEVIVTLRGYLEKEKCQ